ncbi:hypothetical protein [Helicobacter pylori]|uniref:hypothetical protein n=1 Tax=Helicobacter pylori TaxID=210 RepID=UPI0012FDA666|nr:hypothetical protein [Helicobacter pylori]
MLIILNAPSLTYWIAKKVVSILIRYHLSLMPAFNHPKQKSQISLVFGMNATNSWYHIPIHSYLAQEVCKVTPLEI